MSVSQEEHELINWDNITSHNDPDPIAQIIEKAQVTIDKGEKKPRGRPRKKEITPDLDLSKLLPPPEVSPPGDQASFDVSGLSTEQLIFASLANEPSIPPTKKVVSPLVSRGRSPRKSVLRFSDDASESDATAEPDSKWLAAVATYKCFFQSPKLRAKHQREEKAWTNRDSPERIIKECKELQALCSSTDPANVLGSLWVNCMSGVETFGPLWGLKTQQLGACAGAVSQRDDFQETMRELLIKYPYLRMLVTLGGLPELRLAVITITMVNEIHQINSLKEHMAHMQTPDRPVPEDLRSAFSGL